MVRGPWNNDPGLRDSFTFMTQWQGDDTRNIMMLINDVPNNVGMDMWPWNGQRVYFADGEPRAYFEVWRDAFATGVVESSVFRTLVRGEELVLPLTVMELNVATGVVRDASVALDSLVIPNSGRVEIKCIVASEGNMNEVVAYVTVVDSVD